MNIDMTQDKLDEMRKIVQDWTGVEYVVDSPKQEKVTNVALRVAYVRLYMRVWHMVKDDEYREDNDW
jgi:hypothetical protein